MVAVAIGAVLSGCATTPQEPVVTYSLEPDGTQVFEDDRFRMEVEAILPSDIQGTDSPLVGIATRRSSGVDAGSPQEREMALAVADLPMFRLTIYNDRDNILELERFAARLVEANGVVHEPTDSNAIESEFLDFRRREEEAGWVWNLTDVLTKVRELPLIKRDLEVLPGLPTTVYVVFDLYGTASRPYRAWMDSVDEFTLRLFEIPVETDEAGNITRTEKVDFTYSVSADTQTSEGDS
jgi:hypothetical protein